MEQQISPDVLALARALATAAGITSQPVPEEAERAPLTVPEAAAQLRVHEATVYRAIQLGMLGAYSAGSGGRAIRIPAAELDAYKARQIRRPHTGPGR